ncbi:FetA [Neisseria gonorrhoeae]|uniref:FetA n=1 Tax=Neisseria gonorrhoeae TaxID=485 RepID=A0A378W3A6_NEIGO|nr:FetA [Neisseria gonorrhoeae]
MRLNSGFAGNNGVSYGASVFGKEGNFDGLFSYNRNDEKITKPAKVSAMSTAAKPYRTARWTNAATSPKSEQPSATATTASY